VFKHRMAWTSILALAPLVAGCASEPIPIPLARPAQQPVDTLTGVTWHLLSYGPIAAPTALIPGTEANLLLDASSLQFSGLAGCNRFSGSYALSGDKITLGRIAMTKRLCPTPEGLGAQESAVAQALSGAKTYGFENGDLVLRYSTGESLRFSKKAPEAKDAPSLAQLRMHLGQYPRDTGLWNHPLLAQRLRVLLGDKHQIFKENMLVQGPLTEENGLLFVTGNRPHEGRVDMAVFLADPVNDKLQIWLSTNGVQEIFSEAEPPLADPPSVATFKANAAPKP